MQSMNWAVKEEHPETLLIAEDSTIASGVTRPVEHGGHGFDYKWDLGCTSHMMKFFRAPYGRRGAVYNDLTYPMLYHHTENFLLPLGHDEVVHMKRTHGQQDGRPERFREVRQRPAALPAPVRLSAEEVVVHGPGVRPEEASGTRKSRYRGTSTWDHLHRSLQWYVKRLNEVYKYIPAMHEGDNIPNGFEWIECQNYRNLHPGFPATTASMAI